MARNSSVNLEEPNRCGKSSGCPSAVLDGNGSIGMLQDHPKITNNSLFDSPSSGFPMGKFQKKISS